MRKYFSTRIRDPDGYRWNHEINRGHTSHDTVVLTINGLTFSKNGERKNVCDFWSRGHEFESTMILERCWIIKYTNTFNNLKVNDTIRYPLLIWYLRRSQLYTPRGRASSRSCSRSSWFTGWRRCLAWLPAADRLQPGHQAMEGTFSLDRQTGCHETGRKAATCDLLGRQVLTRLAERLPLGRQNSAVRKVFLRQQIDCH